LIAAFRIAIANDDAKAEPARKVLDAIEPRWHRIWQERGADVAGRGLRGSGASLDRLLPSEGPDP
jgi:hypothetical protein